MKRELVAEVKSIDYETGLITRVACYKDEGYREPFYTVNVEDFYGCKEEFGHFNAYEFDDKQSALDYMYKRVRL